MRTKNYKLLSMAYSGLIVIYRVLMRHSRLCHCIGEEEEEGGCREVELLSGRVCYLAIGVVVAVLGVSRLYNCNEELA